MATSISASDKRGSHAGPHHRNRVMVVEVTRKNRVHVVCVEDSHVLPVCMLFPVEQAAMPPPDNSEEREQEGVLSRGHCSCSPAQPNTRRYSVIFILQERAGAQTPQATISTPRRRKRPPILHAAGMKVFAGTACACVAPLAHRVLETLVQMHVFSSNKAEPDKSGVSSWMKDESVADSGGEPGSGDEDALRSFTATDRAWRALREEKRAHARTKKQLVEVTKRVTILEKRLAVVDGQREAEAVERTLMQLEDRQVVWKAMASAPFSTFDGKLQHLIAAHAAACEKGRCDQAAACMKLELELETLQSCYEAISERLVDAQRDASHWKAQQQSALSKLAVEKQETARLAEELRTVKKTAVLMVNRQHVQLHARAMSGSMPQSLPHLPRRSNSDSNTRSFTHVKTGRGSATA